MGRGQQPDFRVSSRLVLIPVSVKDETGSSVPGLSQDDFLIFEDDIPVRPSYFEDQEEPLSVVLLLDVSSSMNGRQWEQAEEAAKRFLDEASRGTEIALTTVRPGSRPTGFTQDRGVLIRHLKKLKTAGGTAFFDAIRNGAELLNEKARFDRQALLILSDGMDFDSKISFYEVEELIKTSSLVIFSVATLSREERDFFLPKEKYYKLPELQENLNPAWILRYFAQTTGGQAFFPEAGRRPADLFRVIAEELRHQYLLGYRPEKSSDRPGVHRIRVELTRDLRGRGFTVRARKSHFH